MKVGPWEVEAISAGSFALDGGAMFGIVPRAHWSKEFPPDEAGRIALTARCLLLRHEAGHVVLVDVGMGTRWVQRARESYAIDEERGLASALEARGLHESSITDVVATHLHFDHVGGLVRRGPDRKPRPTFPDARVHVQAEHLAWAIKPSPRDRASFRAADFRPIEEAEKLVVHEGPSEILPGLSVRLSHGHTPAMQVVVVESGDHGVLFPSDLIPTIAHVRPAWVMAYDNQPLVTVEEKEALLAEAFEKGWMVVLNHDPKVAAFTMVRDKGRLTPVPCDLEAAS